MPYTPRESGVVIQTPHPDRSRADVGSGSIYPMHTCAHTHIWITEHRHLHITDICKDAHLANNDSLRCPREGFCTIMEILTQPARLVTC